MKTAASKHVDGGRQRCLGCGHPRREHHSAEGCTVPKCACEEYALPADPATVTGKKSGKAT